MPDTRLVLVSLNGVPGSGKSHRIGDVVSILSMCPEFDVIQINEPVEEFVESGLLELYYSDISKYGYIFQTFAAITRLKRLRKALDEYLARPNKKNILVMVSERCPQTDRIFFNAIYKQGLVSFIENKIYQSWCDEWTNLMQFRDIQTYFIFLECSLEQSMKRKNERSRAAETKLDQEYMSLLIDEHRSFCQDVESRQSAPILYLDSTVNKELDTSNYVDQLESVIEFVRKNLSVREK